MMWDKGEADSRVSVDTGATTATVSCPSYASLLSALNVTFSATNYANPLNCQDANNWVSGAPGSGVSPPAPDSGILQIKARNPRTVPSSTLIKAVSSVVMTLLAGARTID
jgi:hypothetical protein